MLAESLRVATLEAFIAPLRFRYENFDISCASMSYVLTIVNCLMTRFDASLPFTSSLPQNRISEYLEKLLGCFPILILPYLFRFDLMRNFSYPCDGANKQIGFHALICRPLIFQVTSFIGHKILGIVHFQKLIVAP